MAEIKAKVLEDEVTTPAQKEKMTLVEKDEVIKLDLSKTKNQEQDAVQEQKTEDGVLRGSSKNEEDGQETEMELQGVREEEVILEEITDETDNPNEAGVAGSPEAADPTPQQEEILQEEKTQEPVDLPENIQELVKFMNETGGSIEDYTRLNADYSNVDENTLLREYYKQTKPHLSYDEISFLIEDNFDYDEEIDEERDVKRKKLAHKEAIASAKDFLTGLKDKYYKEVKLGSKLLPEQQKAIEFFNRYNTEQKQADELLQKQTTHFAKETSRVFNNEFKGFNFNVGDKKYRFNVKDVNKVKSQNISSVFDKFVNQDSLLTGSADFHKALFTASNPDSIATHFYQQGKADAVKEMTADAKNINMDPRKTADGFVNAGGIKVRAISGDDNSKLKLKLKNY
tara:strand:+ start:2878 stop:4074 length:1197 start_codon:yes stop_codon:yes gene_type:complete